MYEQVLIAALDCGEFEQAKVSNIQCYGSISFLSLKQYLSTLKRQFPDSQRVLKLEGMVFEAMGW